jgi:hypothetical protein
LSKEFSTSNFIFFLQLTAVSGALVLMDLSYIDENNPVGIDRGDAHILELFKKMKNSGVPRIFVSSEEADIILGLKGVHRHSPFVELTC